MQDKIKTINLPLPFHVGSVNCYLIETDTGFVLIDTGGSNSRQEFLKELESSGCKSGLLKLIILTHGDFDHTGNAAYLRTAFDSKIAMHPDDAGMAEHGDMFVNRKKTNIIIRTLLPMFSGFGKAERFTPDILVEEGGDFTEYGFEAKVISIPGHSKGSIGILTAAGALFCGDLLDNTKEPALNSIMDDLATATGSLEKLRSLGIDTIYPGHGKPFLLRQVRGDSSRLTE
jgi:hydroxyacylglutathione hydrolase